ncbi:MAG: ABC transporter permease [Clostridium sp.]|nr:ABC transporter permease [Clostridium sp.]
MKKYKILLRAAFKKQKGSIFSILFLMLLTSLCMFTSVTLLTSGESFMSAEMERLGFGNFTAWVNGSEQMLKDEIEVLSDVQGVTVQPIIYSGYQINGKYSDNEGQLVLYDGGVPYQFIDEYGKVMEAPIINPGEIYISPAMQSSFDVKIGDTIRFELARQNGTKDFTVAGYFADGFMGSSMIDMKSFLICEEDRTDAVLMIYSAANYDRLGYTGAMLHVFQSRNSMLSDAEFHKQVQENTSLSLYTEFTYSKASIQSYMMLLQNILSGFLLAFSAVLLVVCMVVISHSLSVALEQDRRDLAILKTIGFTGRRLQGVHIVLYGGTVFAGLLIGLLLALPLAHAVAGGMVSSTGMLVMVTMPKGMVIMIFTILLLLLGGFLLFRTAKIMAVRPIQTIRCENRAKMAVTPIRKKKLALWLAIRTLLTNKQRYVGLLFISILLTLFLSIIGTMGTWLGPNGEGLMNAFSVAEHDLGVQPFNSTVPMDEIERIINWYSPVTKTYELAMESVTVNGTQYTANVLNNTDYFHVLSGSVCGGNEVLITDTVANEQGLKIGDTVRIAGNGRAEEYTVSGIYMCANGMGTNIGLSIEGYSKIGDITGFIWCYHYILEDGSVRDYAMRYLQDNYSGIDVHTNSWSGLSGIVSMMHLLIVVIYIIAAFCILISVALISAKLLLTEISDTAICKSLGLRSVTLRFSFALRFLLVSAVGAVLGTLLSILVSGSLVGSLFKLFGIGAFTASHGLLVTLFPPTIVTVLFFAFALLLSDKIGRVNIIRLISENEE